LFFIPFVWPTFVFLAYIQAEGFAKDMREKFPRKNVEICSFGVCVLQMMCCLRIGSLMKEENGIVASGGVAM